jgi:hypothetical protein
MTGHQCDSKEIGSMGKTVGVFSKKEVEGLGPKQRATLKKEALRHIRTSPEIDKIIRAHPKIRKILKAKLAATYSRLKPKGGS